MEYLLANISHADLASSKLPKQVRDGGNGSVLNPCEDHVILTIPFNHATKEGSIFFIGSLDRNSDYTSTIMPEHATPKKTAHNLRPR